VLTFVFATNYVPLIYIEDFLDLLISIYAL
jgi:hypothetical protein